MKFVDHSQIVTIGSNLQMPPELCSAMANVTLEIDAEICVDNREKSLINEFERSGAKGFKVQALPVGDVSCTYCNTGRSWIVERKTSNDLVASICDGRYNEQRGRLFEAAHNIMFIIEGDLRTLPKWHQTMLSSIVSLNVGEKARVYRTWDVSETFDLLVVLIKKLETTSEHIVHHGLTPPKVSSKRKRDASPSICFIRMLCCIPSISEQIAYKIFETFNDLQSLQIALADGDTLRIKLDNGKYIGKSRLEHLKRHLLQKICRTKRHK